MSVRSTASPSSRQTAEMVCPALRGQPQKAHVLPVDIVQTAGFAADVAQQAVPAGEAFGIRQGSAKRMRQRASHCVS